MSSASVSDRRRAGRRGWRGRRRRGARKGGGEPRRRRTTPPPPPRTPRARGCARRACPEHSRARGEGRRPDDEARRASATPRSAPRTSGADAAARCGRGRRRRRRAAARCRQRRRRCRRAGRGGPWRPLLGARSQTASPARARGVGCSRTERPKCSTCGGSAHGWLGSRAFVFMSRACAGRANSAPDGGDDSTPAGAYGRDP